MNTSRPRGVLLTDSAVEALEAALAAWWENAPDSLRQRHLHLTREAIAEKMGCEVKTVRRILQRREGVYESTLKTVFANLGMAWKPHYVIPAQIDEVETAPAPPRWEETSPSQRRGRLPIPLTPLLGRGQEVEAVSVWLGAERLVTLTGAGGVGKTRLAIAVSQKLAPDFPDGVWLVELASLSDPALVAQTIARVLAVKEQPHRSALDTLIEALSGHSLLLVLDNCEHLLDACALLTHSLLSSCPALRLLATSRQPLGLTGERSYRVPSLPLPPTGQVEEPEVASLLEYPGVQLFVERAIQAQPLFCLTPRNASTLVGVCRALDGIPLALELAAARLGSLSLEELASRLGERFHLLRGGGCTALPRHQTLRALIDWSYALLSVSERELLARLSVFAGGCTLAAAESVCWDEAIPQGQVLDVLAGLVDKNLVVAAEPVVATSQEGVTRYHLLETVRQYAAERLLASGQAEAFARKHLLYYTHLAEQEGTRERPTIDQVATSRLNLEQELDNLRAALNTCRAGGEEGAQAGLRLAAALGFFWIDTGRLSEGRERLISALGQAGAQACTPARLKALFPAGCLAALQSDYAAARLLGEEYLALARQLEDKIRNTWPLWEAAFQQGDYARALSLTEEMATLCREMGDALGVANTPASLGRLVLEMGDAERARCLLEEGLAALRQYAAEQGEGAVVSLFIALTQMYLGRVAYLQGDYVRARSRMEECLALLRGFAAPHDLADTLLPLGRTLLHLGEAGQARSRCAEGLELCWQIGKQVGIAEGLDSLALVASWQGEPVRAVRLLGASERLRQKLGCPVRASLRGEHEGMKEAVRQGLGEEAFISAREEGRALTLEQAVAYALEETLQGTENREES